MSAIGDSGLQDDFAFALQAAAKLREARCTGPIRSTFVLRNAVGDNVLYALSMAGDLFVRGVVNVAKTETENAKAVPIWKRLSDRVDGVDASNA